ncbi:hypothetical protein FFLO_01689 [Filobasidium floriforme]|uniref:Uncharacterized protein n=1 Tax=Filobasidium floriforme TaxID=5210 RepID=A0A8K0JP37_9TREE|nr:uncharacterized protein HD553DRAFT_218015 [Filobasidium floriforme]KAG7562860.1 hypothetical protein FFLO_01689 [Filobasidium floriforme]KAH8086453.1 hypothetical protein HD553DRAFT_218015 [Filobasidium floriforme]
MKDEVDDTLDGTNFRTESARIVEVENGKPDKEYRASVQIRINGDDSVGAIGTISRTMTFPFRKDAKADEHAEKTVSQMRPYDEFIAEAQRRFTPTSPLEVDSRVSTRDFCGVTGYLSNTDGGPSTRSQSGNKAAYFYIESLSVRTVSGM